MLPDGLQLAVYIYASTYSLSGFIPCLNDPPQQLDGVRRLVQGELSEQNFWDNAFGKVTHRLARRTIATSIRFINACW